MKSDSRRRSFENDWYRGTLSYNGLTKEMAFDILDILNSKHHSGFYSVQANNNNAIDTVCSSINWSNTRTTRSKSGIRRFIKKALKG